jgi:hypothetical protein
VQLASAEQSRRGLRHSGKQASRFKGETDAADAAEEADRYWRRELSTHRDKAMFFCACRGRIKAPGAIWLFPLHPPHPFPPLNLDARDLWMPGLANALERSLDLASRRLQPKARLELAPRVLALSHALVDEAQTVVG